MRTVPKEHLAVIHPMQYDLERAYHNQGQRAAARQRVVAEAEQGSTMTSTSVLMADDVLGRVRSILLRATRAVALPRRQVA